MAEIQTDHIASWESQVRQYPPTGEPGITHTAPQITVDGSATVVDCLLYRGPDGTLWGIFNHYNEGNPRQAAGSCNLWVHPSHQRQGIASALLREAWHRWPLKEEHQQWSEHGQHWISALVAKGKVDPTISHSLNEEFDWKSPPPGVSKGWEQPVSDPQVLCPFCNAELDINLFNSTYGCDTGCEYVRFEVECPSCKTTVYDTGDFGSMDDPEEEAEYRERYMAEFAQAMAKIVTDRQKREEAHERS